MRKLILFLIINPIFLVAQQRESRQDKEIKTLEKLYELKKQDEKEALEAQEKIMSYRDDVKKEIRDYRSKLSSDEFSYLDSFEKMMWNKIMERYKLYNSSSKFLSNEIFALNNYKNTVLDKLSSLVDGTSQSGDNKVKDNTSANSQKDSPNSPSFSDKPSYKFTSSKYILFKLKENRGCNIKDAVVQMATPNAKGEFEFYIKVVNTTNAVREKGGIAVINGKGTATFSEGNSTLNFTFSEDVTQLHISQSGRFGDMTSEWICFEADFEYKD
ncbi:MAG: hypothetical protein EOP00_21975 [Pedobacter sp.]|nr:MAG: hypothetical protein EOP00_21975 [Pedobacter sp.]